MYTAFSDLFWSKDDDRRSKHVAALNIINNKVVLDVYTVLIIMKEYRCNYEVELVCGIFPYWERSMEQSKVHGPYFIWQLLFVTSHNYATIYGQQPECVM